MRLRRIMEHMKTQNWFAVALDFVIVVIGVGVAMYGQQWLSDRQQRADMAVAEKAIQTELFYNYGNAKERLAVAHCRAQSYKAIAAKLLAPGENWTGIARLDNKDYGAVLPVVFRSPQRTWGSSIWKAELGRGTFNLMTDKRRAELDSIFTQADEIQLLQTDIFELQGRLNVLAVNTPIGRNDRLRYYDVLAELDVKSGSLEINAQQLIVSFDELDIPLSEKDRQGALKFLDSHFERVRKIYGECYQPQEFPILDANFEKAKTP